MHRVQRVPVTEAQGRIHTSTATVSVLPEADEVEIDIPDKDLRIDVYRSSGPGGQSVNTTDSAVRITHLPTGLVVAIQDEKSQHKNKAKAMAVLRARLLEMEQQRQAEERGEQRRSQVGTGERSEKIRTYNFPDDRVTDHRIGLTVHNLPGLLQGDLDRLDRSAGGGRSGRATGGGRRGGGRLTVAGPPAGAMAPDAARDAAALLGEAAKALGMAARPLRGWMRSCWSATPSVATAPGCTRTRRRASRARTLPGCADGWSGGRPASRSPTSAASRSGCRSGSRRTGGR